MSRNVQEGLRDFASSRSGHGGADRRVRGPESRRRSASTVRDLFGSAILLVAALVAALVGVAAQAAGGSLVVGAFPPGQVLQYDSTTGKFITRLVDVGEGGGNPAPAASLTVPTSTSTSAARSRTSGRFPKNWPSVRFLESGIGKTSQSAAQLLDAPGISLSSSNVSKLGNRSQLPKPNAAKFLASSFARVSLKSAPRPEHVRCHRSWIAAQ